MISSPDLVLTVQGQKTGGGGGGGGVGGERTKRDLTKCNLRGPESGPRVNCACLKSDLFSSVQYEHRVQYCVVFCFIKRGSLHLRLKPKHLDVSKAVVQQIDMF